ncbi:MAG: glycosyltransferase family 39 protein [Candidatus Methylomirabilis oxyfera]|nr:glycosyltransferase family 39 protein [Candidatus Methylomirabilis oxyfera]
MELLRTRLFRNPRAALGAIILFTVVVRLGFCLVVYPALSDVPSVQGHDRYDNIARNLLHGSGYALDPAGPPTIKRLPLYPILLYVIYAAVGEHFWAVQLAQVCLAAVTAWLIFLIGRTLFSDIVGLLAAAVFSVHPHLVHYTARPYTETLYVFLICLLAYLLLDIPGPAPRKSGLIAGAVFGLTLLTKGVAIGLPAFFFLGCLLDPSHRRSLSPLARYLFFFLIGTAIIVSPWAYRNYLLTGRAILTSTWEGAPLYHGLYVSSHLGDGRTPGALDRAASLERQQFVGEQLGRNQNPVDEYRADRLAYTVAFKKILGSPSKAAMLFLRNLFLVWFLTRTTFFLYLGLIVHLSLLGLSLYGLAWMVRHDRGGLGKVWAIGSLIIYFNVIYAIAYPFVRYILPVVPLVTVLAAFGLAKILGLEGPSRSIQPESGTNAPSAGLIPRLRGKWLASGSGQPGATKTSHMCPS